MTNNDTLRSLRYTFNFNDSAMIEIFSLADVAFTREQVSSCLKREEDPDYRRLNDTEFASFLNGFIVKNRGKKDGPSPVPERQMTNNLVLKKIKIALQFKSNDVKDIINLAGFNIGEHELSAFFRKPSHGNYRECKDQILRSFLKGLQLKYRPEEDGSKS